MSEKFETNVSNLLKARFPYLYINSWEEDRVIKSIQHLSKNIELIKTPRNLFVWSVTNGIQAIDSIDENKKKNNIPATQNGQADPRAALDFIENYNEPAIFILKDFHVFFGGDRRGAPDHVSIRKLRDLVSKLKTSIAPKNVIFLSPTLTLPAELQKDITVIDFDLPTIDEIKEMYQELIDVNSQNQNIKINVVGEELDRLARAAQGLTLNEAENAFARALAKDGILDMSDLEIITEEKQQIIKKNGTLELINNNINLSEVGGLGNLKKWLMKREKVWLNPPKEYNLPYPKGVLITGVPGCGKSLISKAISASWQSTLLRFDIGRTFSSLVGSSEENMREAIKTAEAVAPCILWIDEIEKGFSGISNANDSGTSSRVFGNFLTWLQEKQAPVFVVATANNISQLPPELMRKGRLDEIFFVDLPTFNERKEIFSLHIKKKIKPDNFSDDFKADDETISELARITEGFTGSEIEQVIIEALFDSYSANKKPSMEDFRKAVNFTVPLSITQAEIIENLRSWANTRAVNATPKDELADYETHEGSDGNMENPETGNAGPNTPPSSNISDIRGGRTLDF